MATAESNLFINIKGDSKSAQAAVTQLRQVVTTEANKIKSASAGILDKAGTNFTQFTNGFNGLTNGANLSTAALSGTAVALGAVVAVGALAGSALLNVAKAASEYASKFADASAETGFNVEKLQLLAAVGTASGVSLEQLTGTILQFEDRLIKAAEGNEKLNKSFQSLGINATKAANDPQAAFFQFATALTKVENAAERVALAKELAGKSGTKFLKVIEDLTSGGEALETKLKSLGIILKGETIAALDEFGDKWDLVKLRAQGALNLIAQEFIPVLNVALGDLIGSADDLKNVWPKIGLEARKFFIEVIVGAKEALFELRKLGSGLQKIFIPDSEADTFGKVIDKWKSGLNDIGDAIKGNSQGIREEFEKSVKAYEDKLKAEAAAATGGAGNRQGTGKTAKDKAAAETKKLLQDQLRTLQDALRAEEDAYRRNTQIVEQKHAERIKGENDYTQSLIQAIRQRDVKEQELIASEKLRILGNKGLPKSEKEKALSELTAQSIALTKESDAEVEAIESAARIRRRQAEEELQRLILQGIVDANTRKINLIKDQVDAEVLTYEEGAKQITAITLEEFDKRIKAQQAIRVASVGFLNEEAEIEKLKQLEAQKTAAVEQGETDRKNAVLKDKAVLRDAINSLRDYLEQRKALANDIAQIRLDGVVASGKIDPQNELRQQNKINIDNINAEADARINALQAQLEAIRQEDVADADAKLRRQAREQQLTELIQLEQDKRVASVISTNQKTQAALNQVNPVKQIQAQIRGLAGAFTSAGLAAISAGQSIGEALRSVAQSTLASIAQIAGTEAIKNVARGFEYASLSAALAVVNPPASAAYAAGSALAFQSAAIWGAIGVGSAVAAGAIGGGSRGGASGSSGGGNLTGTRADENAISTEERFRFRESGAGRPVTTIILVTDQAQQIKNVETSLGFSYSNDGTAKKIIDNALGNRPL